MSKKPKKSVFEKLRPDTTIKCKTRICFGDGIYRTHKEIERVKEKNEPS